MGLATSGTLHLGIRCPACSVRDISDSQFLRRSSQEDASNILLLKVQTRVFIMTCDVHYNPGHGYCLSVIHTFSVMHLQTISSPYNAKYDKIHKVFTKGEYLPLLLL